jgi:hypothetical protein
MEEVMGDQKKQNPNYGSEHGRQDEDQKNQGERAGQSGDRDRASNPLGDSDTERNRQPKPGQSNQQKLDR